MKSSLNIIVGMSGGVDSSIAAYLLKKAGHHVQGVFMKNWEEDDTDTYCPAAQDMEDAQHVCDQLDIPLELVNFADQYWERVFAHCLDEYRLGRTPNPDILCNKEIKFHAFLNYAKQRGADYIATGHYVRTLENKDGVKLQKAHDPQKDQSYFLYALNESQISQCLFPIGHLLKSQVRTIAAEMGFKNHAKKDSTGICFIGERKFKHFLNEYLPARPGNIENIDGEILGKHDGLMFYTIGQRQGLQIGGQKGKNESPWYVAEKDVIRNVLIVVQGEEHPALFKQTLTVNDIHWINRAPDLACALTAKTRYRQADQACTLEKNAENNFRVTFVKPQRAITPGQSIVFYQDDVCLGGGIIEN